MTRPDPSHATQPSESLRAPEVVAPLMQREDEACMRVALLEAQEAARQGEVPVGAAVYHAGVLIAQAHNAPIALCNPTAHAEVLALEEAAKVLGNYRLQECTLYVTLEPCAMCAGAIFNARVREVVYAAKDAKSGVAGSVLDLFADARINHHTRVRGGVLQEPAVSLLQDFFKSQRLLKHQEALSHPSYLREDAIRPVPKASSMVLSEHAQSHFLHLMEPHALKGLRLHCRQSGSSHSSQSSLTPHSPTGLTWLALHGANTSASLFEPLYDALLALQATPSGEGPLRMVAPDLPGYGGSDRFKKPQAYSFALSMQALVQVVQEMDLQAFGVITHDSSLIYGLMLKALMPEQVVSLVGVNASWCEERPAEDAVKANAQAKGRSRSSGASLLAQTLQGKAPALALHDFLNIWLQSGANIGDLKPHFARCSAQLSPMELSVLCDGFEQAFERTVFNAFETLFPTLPQALAQCGLNVQALRRHWDAPFVANSCLVYSEPFDEAALSWPSDTVGSFMSGFRVSDALKGTAFLSQESIRRLARVLLGE